jgi:hypothetical protein
MKLALALAFLAACMSKQPSSTPVAARQGAIVGGTLTTRVVPCTSLCTESQWHGALEGTSRFTLISLEDAQIPNAPNAPNTKLSHYHGDLVLKATRGTLVGQDWGRWNLATGEYVDVYLVRSGTGDYTGVAAVILLWGTLDPTTGVGQSHYLSCMTYSSTMRTSLSPNSSAHSAAAAVRSSAVERAASGATSARSRSRSITPSWSAGPDEGTPN